MNDIPPDLERLVHESLEQLGWDADAKIIAERIQRLNIGLPLEDEFSIICGWLGRCNLVHKLDQQQYPISSKDMFQVPDLLASFSARDGRQYTVLIEVKSSEKNVMSFRPDYISKLADYGRLLGLPVLIAWKKMNIWILVSLDEFTKAKTNYNLNFFDGITNSLMSELAGDFSFTPRKDAGVHFHMKKEELIDTVENEEGEVQNWRMVIENVYFTNGDGEKIRKLTRVAEQLFKSWDLKVVEEHTESHIVQHHIVEEESALFAHMALTRLLSFHSREDSIHWREHLGGQTMLANIQDYRKGIEENLESGIVKYIFDISPTSKPEFMKES